MTTEMIDKLFLELSQFTKAKTKRQSELERGLRESIEILERVPVDLAVSGDVRRQILENQAILRQPTAAAESGEREGMS